jgi:hypothetical protein
MMKITDMNRILTTPVLLVALLSIHAVLLSQNDIEARTASEVGVILNLTRPEGDAPAFVRQYAGDVSTNFGTKALYKRQWSVGYGLYAAYNVQLIKHFGIRLEAQAARYSSVNELIVDYDPAQLGGLIGNHSSVTTAYYNLIPAVMVRGELSRLSLAIGVQANVFLGGRTTVTSTASLANGTIDKNEEQVRLDTQDQPIYRDASQVTGVVDYTNINLRNHGANPIWWSAVSRISYKIGEAKWTPIIGFSWALPLTEIQRSQNPRFSLTRSYSPDLHELALGTKISTMSLHIGWAF